MTTVVWAPEPHHLDAPHTSTVCHVTTRYNDATTTISGPNDAYRVVWALGECFFLIIRCLLYLLLFIIGFRMYPNGGTSNRARDTSRALTVATSHTTTTRPLGPCHCHVTPNPHHPKTHTGPERRLYYRHLGQISIFFIFVFIDIFIDIHVDIFIVIVNVIN